MALFCSVDVQQRNQPVYCIHTHAHMHAHTRLSHMAVVFSQWMSNNEINLGMECAVTVLTTGFWPTYKIDEVALPAELLRCVDTVCMYVCVCIYIYIYIYIYMFSYIHTCVCVLQAIRSTRWHCLLSFRDASTRYLYICFHTYTHLCACCKQSTI
jgi:hypothetical protein